MRKLVAALLCIAALGIAGAQGETYPSRPLTLVVPFAQDGASDVVARVLAQPMQAALGQPIVVENVPDNGGLDGINRVVRAPSDGYTFLLGSSGLSGATTTINPWQLDLISRNLEPIGLIAHMPLLILGRKSLPASDLRGLVEWLQKNGRGAWSGAAMATDGYVATILLQQATHAGFRIVSNRSSAALLKDLAAEKLDIMLSPSVMALRQVRSGDIKAFAVAAGERLGAAPEIPTTEEAGLGSFRFSIWYGLWAPRNTPPDRIAALNDALVRVLEDPVTRRTLATMQVEIFPREQLTPAFLATRQKADYDEWWPIVRGLLVRLRKT